MEKEFTEYKIPVVLGIDDIDYYPGLEAEWWTEKQWKKFYDEAPMRKERDRLYVEQLRMEGRYGKIAEYTIKLQYNPIFDAPELVTGSLLSSHNIVFLNPEEKKHVDFNAWVEVLTRLTARAQATFMNLYIKQMGPSICRTVIKYCYKRLDKINSKEHIQSI